ncbi:MAG TPA: bifunctional rhamnulose-1-phosphate aldolase/short-chain dehydrogenase [Ktedonobacteraceae bacterium]|jgi:rhamnulose-1-phosphate aldolase/alcohol dehydrogenase
MSIEQIIPLADRWSETEAAGRSELDLLVYQSRLLGSDPHLVLWGGGNTSFKREEQDYRGRTCPVLRVKGSGSDLRVVEPRDFPAVRLDDVLALFEREEMSDEAMVEYLRFALLDPGAPRPSIETLLHAFVPARSVVHTHADAILALTNNVRASILLKEVFGDDVALIPYLRPGFQLSKLVGQTARTRPALQGIILLNHGLITWHDDPCVAYRLHLELVNRAACYAQEATRSVHPGFALPAPSRRQEIAARLAPLLRGLLSQQQPLVARFDESAAVLRFVSGAALGAQRTRAVLQEGAATPDHILNVKRTPLWIEPASLDDAQELEQATRNAVAGYIEEYQAYVARYRQDEPMLAPVPRVVLVAGLGMFALGKDSRAAGISADIAHHTFAIMERAEQSGAYRSLPPQEAFRAEYWPLELYKLQLAPPEKLLSRRVALVTGAAGAIGAAIARRFAAEGAHVVCADIDQERAGELAADLTRCWPHNRALALALDVTDEEAVSAAYRRILCAYGGLDVLVSNAGVAHNGALDSLSLADWQRSLAINTTGHFLVVREALRIMRVQGMGGSLVFVATKNVPAPGKDFGAYSAAKAAQAQLARVAALEGGPLGIRSNIINPDAIFSGSGLWSPQVRELRARSYGIEAWQLEAFYRQRNLLHRDVRAEDVAEAALFFACAHSSRTTGAMLPVDGGLREAFPR